MYIKIDDALVSELTKIAKSKGQSLEELINDIISISIENTNNRNNSVEMKKAKPTKRPF